ncbi:MAG: rRNA maturation RNase YbeY [Spirochaetales bacterium]|nr:MAG: rRNA maturation RNase YbeY [Spirochaetales bacterium]
MNRVSIDVRDIEEPAWLERLETFALATLKAICVDDWDLSIVVCGDALIASLNLEYRHREGPTDVLSFEQGEWYDDEAGRRFLAGDVVLSLDALARNASDFGVSLDEELRRLVVHGILHLSGQDHQGNEADEPMIARQEEILKSLAEERIF